MKKIFTVFQATLVMYCLCLSVYAAVPETVTPLWDNINVITSDITFDGTEGNATAVITGKSGTTEIIGTLAVYEKVGTKWEYVDQCSDSNEDRYLVLSVDFTGEPEVEYKSVLNVLVTRDGMNEVETDTTYETCPKVED